MSSFVQTARK